MPTFTYTVKTVNGAGQWVGRCNEVPALAASGPTQDRVLHLLAKKIEAYAQSAAHQADAQDVVGQHFAS